MMAGNDMQKTVEKIIEAHGGASRWRKLEAVEAIISVRGFLFKAKRRVLPLLIGNKPLAGPVIVAIDIHELHLKEATN